MKSRKGFTLFILIVVVLVFILTIAFWISFLFGNFWFTESGALREIQFQNPEVVKIVSIDRNLYSCSKIVVEDKNGSIFTYDLDTWIICSYDVELAE